MAAATGALATTSALAGLTVLAAAETFEAAGAACLATGVFLTTVSAAGMALTAGFFTVRAPSDNGKALSLPAGTTFHLMECRGSGLSRRAIV